MSLFEQPPPGDSHEVRPEKDSVSQFNDPIPEDEGIHAPLSETFRRILEPVMTIIETHVRPFEGDVVYRFYGDLNLSANKAYDLINDPIEAHGYTLYMQRLHSHDDIMIAPGVIESRRFSPPWWLHMVLLAATMLTTLFAAALLYGYTVESIEAAINDQNRVTLLQIYRRANDFAWPLLFILGLHEMGHYIAARLHKVKVTLPFFIPLPLAGSLGTLGAVIFIKSPFRNRKQLFDVGIAGPLAGLVAAIPIFIYGLDVRPDIPLFPRNWLAQFNAVSVPPFLEFVASFVRTDSQLERIDANIFFNHPTALAAWFGVLLTSLNLLPMGQFDGGHVAFAMFGRRIAWPLATFTALACFSLGVSGILGISTAWPIWFIWPLFAMFTGLRHPPPHDDITPIGWPRMVIGLITFALLLTMIVIAPFYDATAP